MTRTRLGATLALALTALVLGAPHAHAQLVTVTFTGAEPFGPNRLTRNGTPSVAGVQKAFPGNFGNNTTFFFTQAVTIPVGQTITVTQNTGGFDIFVALYRSLVDPNNLATNYVADTGSSGAGEVLGFTNTAGSTSFLAVVTNVQGHTAGSITGVTGSFTMSVGGASAPEPGTLALLALGGVAVIARRRTSRLA
ncbi:PEP-CTERM sorting domain-containing protein [Armatimonas sp.]|uniref:PEP-CTERM sorting domain-containing protein n=1 Tax=Armatimonas sp. TaxID=1872638 RepID=UPI00286C2D64|nr:PEP-CTERM sorting domain-containing protein [Armatimonas sp.]